VILEFGVELFEEGIVAFTVFFTVTTISCAPPGVTIVGPMLEGGLEAAGAVAFVELLDVLTRSSTVLGAMCSIDKGTASVLPIKQAVVATTSAVRPCMIYEISRKTKGV
jgi:hypothetical protein